MGNVEKFDAAAERYDTPERIEIASIIVEALRSRVENGKQKTAIDFGCGTGLVGLGLLRDFESVLFLDASANMLRVAEQKIRRSGQTNAGVLCCNLEEETPPDLRADYIILAQVLLHIQDIEPVLARLYKMLNAGGHLLIVDFDLNDAIQSNEIHSGFEQGYLADLLARLGYCKIQSATFYRGEKLLMNQDASMFLLDAKKP